MVGVIDSEQVADAPVPESVHIPLGVNVMVPDGVLAVPAALSVTVATQVVTWLTTTVFGEQATLVAVVRNDCTVTITVVCPELVA
jgi:predicted TIM-barrel enzyme